MANYDYTEMTTPIITEAGKISGRDAIYLDKIHFENEGVLELTGEFNESLCDKLDGDGFRNYKVVFQKIMHLEMYELDYDSTHYKSAFDQIIKSVKLQELIAKDKENNIGKIDATFNHYLFRTYDTVFSIICKKFDMTIG